MYKVHALAESLKPYDVSLHVLLVDKPSSDLESGQFNIYHLSELAKNELTGKIIKKYSGNKDKIRWGMKPLFLHYLLNQSIDELVYVDNDIFFYQSPEVIFQSFRNTDILLTPHFYPSDPVNNQNWLEANYRVGLYNAGFIGVNKNATDFLDWWGKCCLYSMKKSYWRGLFDDQKYLDLVPIQFNGVEVLKNKGLNIAGWNDHPEGSLAISKKEIVFVHFADLTLEKFSNPAHSLHSFYEEYIKTLRKYNPNYKYKKEHFSLRKIDAAWYFLKWKLIRLFE